MRTKRCIVLLLAAIAAPIALANHYADLYVIPAAARIAGGNNTFWVSDVAIQNFQATPLTVEFLFVESGEGKSENISNLVSTTLPAGNATIPAGGSVYLRDVLNGFDGKTDGLSGAIIASAPQPFAVTSRVSTTPSGGGSFGQTILPVRDFMENAIGDTNNPAAVAYVPGLVSNSTYRTNLGFLAAAGSQGMVVEITLRVANGSTAGSRSFSIPPNRFVHVQISSTALSATTFEAGSAEFRISSGDGAAAPYASVVDNRSGDGVYVSGVFPPNAAFAKRAAESMFATLLRALTGR